MRNKGCNVEFYSKLAVTMQIQDSFRIGSDLIRITFVQNWFRDCTVPAGMPRKVCKRWENRFRLWTTILSRSNKGRRYPNISIGIYSWSQQTWSWFSPTTVPDNSNKVNATLPLLVLVWDMVILRKFVMECPWFHVPYFNPPDASNIVKNEREVLTTLKTQHCLQKRTL